MMFCYHLPTFQKSVKAAGSPMHLSALEASTVSGGNPTLRPCPTVLYASWHKIGTAASEGCERPKGRGFVLRLWISELALDLTHSKCS